jgi:hypothetical protein
MGDYADDEIFRGMDEGSWYIPKGVHGWPSERTNKEVYAARCRAHAAFDPIWQSGEMVRSEAYVWLAEQLGVRVYKAHIKRMGIAECDKVVEICTRKGFEDLIEEKTS